MRLTILVAPITATLLIMSGAHAQSATGGQAAPTSPAAKSSATRGGGALSSTDKSFLEHVAQGADYELTLAKLAEQKATRTDLKEYARTIVDDHQQMNASLHQLADQKGLQLPTGMTHQQQAKIDRLNALSGPKFDQAYLSEVTRINKEDKTSLRKEIGHTQDAAIKGFAEHMQSVDAKHEDIGKKLERQS